MTNVDSDKTYKSEPNWLEGLPSPVHMSPSTQFSSYRSTRFNSPNLSSFKKGRHGWTPVIRNESIPANLTYIDKTADDMDQTLTENEDDTDIESPIMEVQSLMANIELQTQAFPSPLSWSPIRTPQKSYDSDATRLDSNDHWCNGSESESMSPEIMGCSTVKRLERMRQGNEQALHEQALHELVLGGDDSLSSPHTPSPVLGDKPPVTWRRLTSPQLTFNTSQPLTSNPCDWAIDVALSPSQVDLLFPQKLTPSPHHKQLQSEQTGMINHRLYDDDNDSDDDINVNQLEETAKTKCDLALASQWVKRREALRLEHDCLAGGALVHDDDWEFASELIRIQLKSDPLISPGVYNKPVPPVKSQYGGIKLPLKTLVVGSRNSISKWTELLQHEMPQLRILDMSGKRLQPRLASIIECDVVLCTVETLSKHRSTDPWGELKMDSCAKSPAWSRKPLQPRNNRSSDKTIEHKSPQSPSQDEEGIFYGLEEPVACHTILHQIIWGRVVIDDTHLALRLPTTFRTWLSESDSLGSLGVVENQQCGIRYGKSSQTSIAKSEALALLRGDRRWLLLSSLKVPKLWKEKDQLRKLANLLGAPSRKPLANFIPKMVLKLG